ncbi:MAG TPA: hypothetical protein VH372_09885 [Actinospica sp.]|nr:hypothetical protein [Actinospica sp.]
MAGDGSESALARKLGIKAGHRVAVLAAPAGFAAALGELPAGCAGLTALNSPEELVATAGVSAEAAFDVIIWFGTTLAGLHAIVRDGRAALTPAGGLWIGWAKRNSGIATEVTADVVREIALPTGLVDNKICAIDDR